MNIYVFPLDRIELNSQSICIGCDRNQVVSCLGKPEAIHENRYYYFGAELAFDCNSDGKIEYIEFLGGREGKIQPIIYGCPAFSVKADELLAVLTRENSGSVVDNEGGYSYTFPNIEVGIYREMLPQEVAYMRQQAEEEGKEIDEQEYDRQMSRAMYWSTLGVGKRGYYN